MLRTLLRTAPLLCLLACGGGPDLALGVDHRDDEDRDGDGFSPNEGDCDDEDPTIHPDGDDFFGDGVDGNCDGVDGIDADGDGYATRERGGDDCDDTDPAIHPDAEEIGWDGIDQDCDGLDLRDYVDLCGGDFHTCAIRSDGILDCWGANDLGQTTAPASQGRWLEVSCGQDFACAVDDTGKLECWGDDSSGQSTGAPTTGTWIHVSAGHTHACGVAQGGEVQCWGADEFGEVSGIPATPMKFVAAGADHTCGIADDANGGVICWGDDSREQSTPPAGSNWRLITAGRVHTCAITSDARMECWGDRNNDQLDPPVDAGPYTQLEGHYDTTCAVQDGIIPHCWGLDTQGAVSDKPTVQMVAMAAGRFHACGIQVEDGRVICWGSNSFGQADAPP